MRVRQVGSRWLMASVVAAFMLGLAQAAVADYASAVQALNPQAYWRLNESTGQALDATANLHDSVGVGTAVTQGAVSVRDGDTVGGYTVIGFGSGNTAYSFAGAGQTTNNRVDFGEYYPNTGFAARTEIAWIKADDVTGQRSVFSWGSDSTSPRGQRYRGRIQDGKWTLEINGAGVEVDLNGPDNVLGNEDDGTAIAAGQWYMVAIVVPGGIDADSSGAVTSGQAQLEFGNPTTGVRLYVNGVRQPYSMQTTSFTQNFSTAGSGNGIDLGVRSGNTHEFDGLIDEVALFNVDLSDAQIASLFAAAVAVPEPASLALLAIGAIGLLGRARRPRV